jgi:hypothetical protein
MRNFKLKIAGYNIGFESAVGGPGLTVAGKFLRNLSTETECDVHIRIHSGLFNLPAAAESVFHAPFVEEQDGILIHKNPDFWSVWKHNSELYIKTTFPLSREHKNGLLRFSMEKKEWDLWIESDGNDIDPFEYPLDGLILYYLTVINRDIMIHASGVNYAGNGFLFSGVSGKGKSTMAGLWDDYGAKVIHDDRLIIRKTGEQYRMFNTPVYSDDTPCDSSCDSIFIVEHGDDNRLFRLKDGSAVSQVLANCIQHTWNTDMISRLTGAISEMCNVIPIYRLQFLPDGSVIHHILTKR